MSKRRQVAGRCTYCGRRWKRGAVTKRYCSSECRVNAWHERRVVSKLRARA